MSEEELCEITLAHGFGPAMLAGGTGVVAGKPENLIPMLREIERRTLERAYDAAMSCDGALNNAGAVAMKIRALMTEPK